MKKLIMKFVKIKASFKNKVCLAMYLEEDFLKLEDY